MPTLKTKRKQHKRQKLRNAEYYDFHNVQDELYEKSLGGSSFNNLLGIITSDENIRLAYRNIKNNKGSKTAGVDNKNINYLAKWDLERLIQFIKKKFDWYEPQAVRRVEIPKDNGKTRPLGIPTIVDRLIQQCILQVLEPICEAKFHDNSYGFRPNRSQEHAIAQTSRYMQIHNLHYVVDIDIKGFFDNVNHGKLLKQIWALGVRDKKLIKIISLMLKAEIAGVGFPEVGTPQGSIISPLLSNIVLNELDWWIASQWALMPTKYKYSTTVCRNGTQSQTPKFNALKKTNLKECFSVRFADDFKIFCRNKQDAEKLFIATRLWLKDRLGLEISPEKSKIVNLKNSYSTFLGFNLRVHKKGKTKKDNPKYAVQSHTAPKAQIKIKSNAKRLIKDIKDTGNIETAYKALCRYNSYVLGVHNYFALATDVSCDFHKIAFLVKTNFNVKFKEALKRSSKLSLPKYFSERYGDSAQARYLCGYPIIPIGYVQHKSPMCKQKAINQYTKEGRKQIHKMLEYANVGLLTYVMRNPVMGRSVEFNDNRLAVFSAQCGKCGVTKEYLKMGQMHCHHKIPLKLGGNDKYANLIFVSENVHKLIHAVSPLYINELLALLKLTDKQLNKVNLLRVYAQLEQI